MKVNKRQANIASITFFTLVGLLFGIAGSFVFISLNRSIDLQSTPVASEQTKITCSLDYSLIADKTPGTQSSFRYKLVDENDLDTRTLMLEVENNNLNSFTLPLTNFPNDYWRITENSDAFLVIDYLSTKEDEVNLELNDRQLARLVLDKTSGSAILTRSLHDNNSEGLTQVTSASYFFSCR